MMKDNEILRKQIGSMLMFGFDGSSPEDKGVQKILKHIKAKEIIGVIFNHSKAKSHQCSIDDTVEHIVHFSGEK